MFKGRLNRSTYILANVLVMAIVSIFAYSGVMTDEETFTLAEIVLVAIAAVILVLQMGVYIRRGHDLGLPGIVTILFSLLPGVAIALAIIPSQKFTNKYGAKHTKKFDFSALFSGTNLN
jgi:uncharacterized membrane protein YhaH (DUF805 family)